MTNKNYLAHYGILGQKWGVRRYQNLDGSRTSAGLAHDREIYAEKNGNSSSSSSGSSAREGLTDAQKEALKTVGKVALAAAAVGATAYLYTKNKEQIDGLISEMGKSTVSKVENRMEKGKEAVHDMLDMQKHYRNHMERERQISLDRLKKGNELADELRKAGHDEETIAKAVDKFYKNTRTVSERMTDASVKFDDAVKSVSNKAKTVASAPAKVKSAASGAAKSVKTASAKAAKSAGEGLAKAAKTAENKATAYLVTQAMQKASEQRLKKRQERNRHVEEMERIRRGR